MTTIDASIRELQHARHNALGIYAVHYGCESWYDVKDRPVGVSCISMADIAGGEVLTFSVTDRKEDGERYVLHSFFDFCGITRTRGSYIGT